MTAKKDDKVLCGEQGRTMTLKVREALPKDVGRIIARIDP